MNLETKEDYSRMLDYFGGRFTCFLIDKYFKYLKLYLLSNEKIQAFVKLLDDNLRIKIVENMIQIVELKNNKRLDVTTEP